MRAPVFLVHQNIGPACSSLTGCDRLRNMRRARDGLETYPKNSGDCFGRGIFNIAATWTNRTCINVASVSSTCEVKCFNQMNIWSAAKRRNRRNDFMWHATLGNVQIAVDVYGLHQRFHSSMISKILLVNYCHAQLRQAHVKPARA